MMSEAGEAFASTPTRKSSDSCAVSIQTVQSQACIPIRDSASKAPVISGLTVGGSTQKICCVKSYVKSGTRDGSRQTYWLAQDKDHAAQCRNPKGSMNKAAKV